MPGRHRLPLGFGESIAAEQWRVEAGDQGSGGSRAEAGEGDGTEHPARRIHQAGREGGRELGGQLGQGSGSPGQLWVGEGEEEQSPLHPVCVPTAPHGHSCNPHDPPAPLLSSPGS